MTFHHPLLLAPPLLFFLLDKMRQLAIAHHELMNVASTDALTNVLNRRAFTEMVGEYLKRVEDSSAPSHGALLVVDVDHFKAVNDNFGHEHGDHALQIIAKTIAESLRDTDLVGRLGGEEFGIFLPLHTPERTSVVAERIRLAVNQADFIADGRRHGLSISVGGCDLRCAGLVRRPLPQRRRAPLQGQAQRPKPRRTECFRPAFRDAGRRSLAAALSPSPAGSRSRQGRSGRPPRAARRWN
ncbi:MAG: GGDEF domain-containing protein [Brucellaceae bacterium]|nr:GGDEF domain-containing protein [Brucellaceae bacterium]